MCYKIGSGSAVRNVASDRICGAERRERLDKLEKEDGSDHSLVFFFELPRFTFETSVRVQNWNRDTEHKKGRGDEPVQSLGHSVK